MYFYNNIAQNKCNNKASDNNYSMSPAWNMFARCCRKKIH